MSKKKMWTVPGWWQFDIECYNFYDLVLKEEYTPIKNIVLSTVNQIQQIRHQNILIEKLFFLYEGKYIRVRYKSSDYEKSKELIESRWITEVKPYTEEKWKFDSIESVEHFAEIMVSISNMVFNQFAGKTKYDTYRMYERISHCTHNLIYGIQNEEVILLKRLSERLGDLNRRKSAKKLF